MLTVRIKSSYRNAKATRVFVGVVSGTDEEKEEYLKIQRKRAPSKSDWVDENGNPLFFTSTPSSSVFNLIITTNGSVVQDTTARDLNTVISATEKANYDHTYETAKRQLASQGAVGSQQREQVKEKDDASL